MRSIRAEVSWASVIQLIHSGEIRIDVVKPFGRDWRAAVRVDRAEFCEKVKNYIECHSVTKVQEQLGLSETAQILGVPEKIVSLLATRGILPKARSRPLAFAREHVEGTAKRYIFGREMLQRTGFRIGHQLKKFLEARGVEPVLRLKANGNGLGYDRSNFDAMFPLATKCARKPETSRFT